MSFTDAHWREGYALADYLVGLVGGPKALAARTDLTRRMVHIIRDWLRLTEAFLRRLILIDALALPRPNPPPPQPPGGSLRTQSTHGRPGFWSDDPCDWSVSFRLTPPLRRPRRDAQPTKPNPTPSWLRPQSAPYALPGAAPIYWEAHAHLLPPAGPVRAGVSRIPFSIRDPRPLAERLEALLRVIEHHEAYAERLSRRLYDQRAPDLVERILILPPRSPADPDGSVLDAPQQRALDALDGAHKDTS